MVRRCRRGDGLRHLPQWRRDKDWFFCWRGDHVRRHHGCCWNFVQLRSEGHDRDGRQSCQRFGQWMGEVECADCFGVRGTCCDRWCSPFMECKRWRNQLRHLPQWRRYQDWFFSWSGHKLCGYVRCGWREFHLHGARRLRAWIKRCQRKRNWVEGSCSANRRCRKRWNLQLASHSDLGRGDWRNGLRHLPRWRRDQDWLVYWNGHHVHRHDSACNNNAHIHGQDRDCGGFQRGKRRGHWVCRACLCAQLCRDRWNFIRSSWIVLEQRSRRHGVPNHSQ